MPAAASKPKGKGRKRKSDDASDEPPQQDMTLTQEGRFVPRFSKRLKTKLTASEGSNTPGNGPDTKDAEISDEEATLNMIQKSLAVDSTGGAEHDHLISCDNEESLGDCATTDGHAINDQNVTANMEHISHDEAVLPISHINNEAVISGASPIYEEEELQNEDGNSEEVTLHKAKSESSGEEDGAPVANRIIDTMSTPVEEPVIVPDDNIDTALPHIEQGIITSPKHKPHPPSNEHDSIDIDDMESIYLDFEALNDMVTMATSIVPQEKEGEIIPMAVPTVSPQKPCNTPTCTSEVPMISSPSMACRTAVSDGTDTIRGLVEELTVLNQFLVSCKKELEIARKQHNSWLRQQRRSK